VARLLATIRLLRSHVAAALDTNFQRRLIRLLLAALAVWSLSAVLLYRFEPPTPNSDFQNLGDYFWGVIVYLFSGLEQYVPRTTPGKVVAGATLISAAVFVAVFTAEIVGLVVELTRRRGLIPKKPHGMRFRDHVVICNWSASGMSIVGQLRSGLQVTDRPVVVVSNGASDISVASLPFAARRKPVDVWAVDGSPGGEVALALADAREAACVVVLEPPTRGGRDEEPLVCVLAARAQSADVPIGVEMIEEAERRPLVRAGATFLASSEDIGARIMAQAALNHGLSTVFSQILANSTASCEPYFVTVPEGLVDIPFSECLSRSVMRSVIPIGVRRADGTLMLNPPPQMAMARGDCLAVLASTESIARSAILSVSESRDLRSGM